MTKADRLLIIGGTGRDSGKSTLAALLISKFTSRGVTAIKITPHVHPEMSGLTLIAGKEGFHIYEERNSVSEKDSSRMLRAGASKVFLIISGEATLGEAFTALQPFLTPGTPIICESPALRRIVSPDLFILMMHAGINNPDSKNIDDLIPLADSIFTLNDLDHYKADIIDLDADNHWHLKY
ncbi:MAG TPA: hypothetical protein VMV74_01825 [Bacteroidales bacterium]|nr:hypothetical protein [Bacteroidales bacterium]